MKRLLSAIIVSILVYLALAFTSTKGGSWCGSAIRNTDCHILNGKTELPNGHPANTYFIYKAWNGTVPDCLPNRCDDQVWGYNEQ